MLGAVLESLVASFKALSDEQLENLYWHAEHGTGICCGKEWKTFLTVDGRA